MRNLNWILLILPFFGLSQASKEASKKFVADSIKSIILLDAYNDNYERVWGRKYLIESINYKFQLSQTEEYYRNYEFDLNKIKFDSLKLLKASGVSKSRTKKLTKQINKRNKNRYLIKEKMDSIVWGTSKKPKNWKEKRNLDEIDKTLIDSFISILNSKNISPYLYLKKKGIDSLWLQNNSERLYHQWLEMHPYAENTSKIKISKALKDYSVFKKTFFSSLLSGNFTTYPYLEITIVEKNLDSTKLVSQGQSLFQVPYVLNSKKTYNPELSVSISKLIPDEQFYSVQKRLNPKWPDVEKTILYKIEDVYDSEIRKKK